MNKRPIGLFADKSQKIFSKIEFVNALTPKEISNLKSKYLFLGLHIKQVIVDNFGKEKNKDKPKVIDYLGKKRERKEFNSLNDFLHKYYGEDDLSSISRSSIKKNKKRKISEKKVNKKYTKEDLSVLKNSLNSIKQDCQKIEYRNCKNEEEEFKSTIIEYILKFKKYISKEDYDFLFNKWKNEFSKLKGVDLFNFNNVNNLLNWKISILKAFKSEISLYAFSTVCDNVIKGKINFHNDEENKEENTSKSNIEQKEEKKEDSSNSDLSDFSDEDNNFNEKNNAILLQLAKKANNDEEI